MTGPNAKQVLIAGGGVAALEAALALRALAAEHVKVQLLTPATHFTYRPLAVAEPFGLGETQRFDLRELCEAAGASLVAGSLAGLEANARHAYTVEGEAIPYDALLVATGAAARAVVPGALTFTGPRDGAPVRRLLDELAVGEVHNVAFAAPWGASWILPLYELALMTAAFVADRGLKGVELSLVTPEDEPLQLFGPAASHTVRALLEEREIAVHTRAYPVEVRAGELRLVPGGAVEAERVIALPRLRGLPVDGLPQNVDGFVGADLHGRVPGLADVYAAGDITSFPVKQGGIAAQQAAAAAEAIASAAGAAVTPQPFRPILRGLLLTGARPRFLRRDLAGGAGDNSDVATDALWWPPAKIVGRYLAPFLAQAGGADHHAPESPQDAVPVDVELDAAALAQVPTGPLLPVRTDGARTVDELMREVSVAAPEDTLAECAERMREGEVGVVVVADFGRLVGILTARDLVRAFAGRVHPSEARAREWMTAEPLSVSPDMDIDSAATMMAEYGIDHLPVVERGRPIGVVRLRDAARAALLLSAGAAVGLGF